MKEAPEWQLNRPTWLQLKTRDTMWIYVAMIFVVSGAWSLETGTNKSTSVIRSTSLPFNVTRNLAFNLGSDVNLTCSDKTWNETMYVIWNIQMNYKSCRIAFSNNGGKGEDSCNDGKSLQNTSRSQPYLRIPSFSNKDIGAYICELAYKGGVENYAINVSITASPNFSGWLEDKDNKVIAVCKAEGVKSTANISWSHGGNSAYVNTVREPDGLMTVESRLEFTKGMEPKNLACSFRDLSWEKEKILLLNPEGYTPWLISAIVVVVIAFFMGLAFFLHKKLKVLRPCQQSDISSSKSPTTEDVEEVEPYASYVQRVNSIYN